MTPADLVAEMWDRIARQNWAAFRELLADDIVLEYPVTGERFVGADNVVAINAEYPEGWSIRLLRIVADANSAVSEVEVPMEGIGIFRAASFFDTAGGCITKQTEYWTSLSGEKPPAWRRRFSRGDEAH